MGSNGNESTGFLIGIFDLPEALTPYMTALRTIDIPVSDNGMVSFVSERFSLSVEATKDSFNSSFMDR